MDGQFANFCRYSLITTTERNSGATWGLSLSLLQLHDGVSIPFREELPTYLVIN